MYCGEMSLHLVTALDSTELVEETNIRGSEGRQRLVSRCRIGFADRRYLRFLWRCIYLARRHHLDSEQHSLTSGFARHWMER